MLVGIIHQDDIEPAVEWAVVAIKQVSELIPTDIVTSILGSWSIKKLNDRNFKHLVDPPSLYRNDQVNCNVLVRMIGRDSFFRDLGCDSVLYLVSKDMFLDEKNEYVVGGADEKRPAIVSTYRFSTPEFEDLINGMLKSNGFDQLKEFVSREEHKSLDPVDLMRIECTKTVVMHELGHVLGLIPEDREDIENGDTGTHCKSRCVMRGGLNGVGNWIEYALNRQLNSPYCSECLSFLIS